MTQNKYTTLLGLHAFVDIFSISYTVGQTLPGFLAHYFQNVHPVQFIDSFLKTGGEKIYIFFLFERVGE